MKYKYRNLKKHVSISGIPPGETKVFDEKIIGGAVELIEVIDEEKQKHNKKNKGVDIK